MGLLNKLPQRANTIPEVEWIFHIYGRSPCCLLFCLCFHRQPYPLLVHWWMERALQNPHGELGSCKIYSCDNLGSSNWANTLSLGGEIYWDKFWLHAWVRVDVLEASIVSHALSINQVWTFQSVLFNQRNFQSHVFTHWSFNFINAEK